MATTRVMGSSAAMVPFNPITAVIAAASSMSSSSSRRELDPARATTAWPSQVVTPVASRPSLTTNSPAISSTAGSANPANASDNVMMPSP